MSRFDTDIDTIAVQERKRRYHSTRWRKLRKNFLRDNRYCVLCMKEQKLSLATVVDHAEGHGHGWEARFWEGPFDPLCAHHHATKTKEELKPDLSRPWRV